MQAQVTMGVLYARARRGCVTAGVEKALKRGMSYTPAGGLTKVPRLRLKLFGDFEARVDDGAALTTLPAKGQALFAYLALHPAQALSRERLAALLWGNMDNQQALRNLRHTVFTIRRATADRVSAIVADGRALRLEPALVRVDALEFGRLIVGSATPDTLRVAAS